LPSTKENKRQRQKPATMLIP